MKTLYILFAFIVLSCQSAFSQFIWHPDLGVPVFDTIRVSADTRSRIVRIDTGDEFCRTGAICSSLNDQLLAAGVRWIRLDFVENPETCIYELCFDLDENTGNLARSIHLGDSARAYILFTQIGKNDFPMLDLPEGNQFVICPGVPIEFRLRNTAENQKYELYWEDVKFASYDGTSKGITCHIEAPFIGSYKFKNFGPEFRVSYYDAFNYIYGIGDEVFTMDANGGLHKFFFNNYLDENMQPHSISCVDDIGFLKAPFEVYNAGKSKYWNPRIRLSYGYDEKRNSAYIQISCPPNLSPQFIHNASGLKVDENIRLDIQQDANGSIVKSPVDYRYNEQRSVVEITIKTTQPEVIYTVYRDGISQQDYIGTGNPLFIAMPKKSGVYRIIAHYEENGYSDNEELIEFYYNKDMIAVDIDKNWIVTKTHLGNGDSNINVNYFNGLGLLEQSIGVKSSSNNLDLVQPFGYDKRLRSDAKTYLSYEAASDDGRFRSAFDSELSNYYIVQYGSDGNRPFFEQVYEASPFDRVQQQAMPGRMRGSVHYTEMSYVTNQANDVYELTVNGAGELICEDYYAAGKLTCARVVDADGQKSIKFTNGLGQVILERRIDEQQFIDTYSVYDADGLLRWVVSPNGSDSLMQASPISLSSEFARLHCYAYVYDNRGNLIQKYLPGRDPIYYVYDTKDRLVKQQDGNMRAGVYSSNRRPQWITYEYDDYGRIARQSVVTGNAGSNDIQFFAQDDDYEKDTSSQMITQYAYDSYIGCPASLDFIDIEGYTVPIGQTRSLCDRRVRGFLTYERLMVISPTSSYEDHLDRAFYYDYSGRVIQTVEIEKNSGNIHRTTSKYDFTGNLIAQYESYMHDDITDYIERSYEYDRRNRLTKETAKLNEGEKAVVSFSYDELGRLARKKYGEGADAINEIYTYNIQGLLTRKNNDLFHLDLQYYNPKYRVTPARYGGDISEIHWQHLGDGANDAKQNSYLFKYDKLARLNDMQHYIDGAVMNQNAERRLLYDKNGNLLTLVRYNNGTQKENELFVYKGNQIFDVNTGPSHSDDHAMKTSSILDPPVSGEEIRKAKYFYDQNGNITTDKYRSNRSYSYNILNLLSQSKSLKQSGGLLEVPDNANYSYLADGTKVSAERYLAGDRCKYVGSFVYDMRYLATGDGSAYNLESASFGDGRIIAGQSDISKTYTPHYFLTDHLGSVRVVADNKNAVSERNDYYPFGKRWTTVDFPVSDNRYLFNGKEDQKFMGLDLLDYGARMYNSGNARWITQDPMAEKYQNCSTLEYSSNTSMIYVDSNGIKAEE